MHGSGSVVSWIKGSARWAMVLAAMAVGSAAVWAQDAIPDTFHITEPAIANPNSNGWHVDPRLGRLSVSIPIGVMPGEISFPISLTMNATPTTRSKRVIVKYTGPGENQPVYGVSTNTTPIACGVNLPAITPTPTGARITLEDGRTYYSSDFTKTATPFSNHTANPAQLFSAYGFSQPGSSIGLGSFPGWAVSADGSLIVSAATSFGPYQDLINSLVPSWEVFSTCGGPWSVFDSRPYFSGFTLLMDKDRARVFARFSYQRPDTKVCTGSGSNQDCKITKGDSGSVAIPIFIVDRFRHYVTMTWSGTPSLNNIVSVTPSMRRVDVRNQRGQGFTVRMNNRSSDLARLDFVNVSGPSALITGSGPAPYWLNMDPETLDPKPIHKTTWGPESIGCPTTVTLGNPETLPQPSWSGSSALGSPSFPPPTLASENSVANRVWNLAYGQVTLASIKDPMGVQSEFKTVSYPVPQTLNVFELPPFSTLPDTTGMWPDHVTGVYQVNQTDRNGVSRLLTWDRQFNPAILVKHEDVWDPGVNQADRYTTYDFGGFSDPGGPSRNPTDTGNGFLNKWTLYSVTGGVVASEERQSGTVKTSSVYSKGSGLNGFLSILKQSTYARLNELSLQRIYTPVDESGLQTKMATTFYGTSSAGPWNKTQESATFFNNRWAMLETQQVSMTQTQRFSAGAPIPPGVTTTTNEWDTATSPLLQLQKTYRNNGGLQHGSKFTYDDQGRLSTQGIHHSENGTAPASPNTLTMTYDDAVTGQPTKWETKYQEGSTTGTLTRTQGNFDSGHRPTLAVDEKGVSTHTTYDLYGRPLTIQKDGEAPISISYPDEWTRITTQAEKTTTEHFDGFGRLIKQELPDGRIVVPTYDLHSRVVTITETNKIGITRTSTTAYDLLDRVVSQTSFTGKRVAFDYYIEGTNNVVKQTVKNLTPELVTVTKTDPFGQVVSVTAPNGDVTSYTYDGHGNKTQVTITPVGGGTPQIRTFRYDLLGRLISKWEPETGTRTFSNFNALNMAQTLVENGVIPANGARTRTLAYDGLGRLRSQNGAGVAETFTYQGSFLTNTIRSVGTDVVTQTFAYKGPGARLSQESTTSQVMGQ